MYVKVKEYSAYYNSKSYMNLLCSSSETYIRCPYPCPCPPMPISFGWAWVRYYCSWVGIGGHGWDIIVNVTQASMVGLTKRWLPYNISLQQGTSSVKPPIVEEEALFVRSNQDLVQAGNTHYTIFGYMSAICGHGWAQVAADGYDMGMGTNSKENVGLCSSCTSTYIDFSMKSFRPIKACINVVDCILV